MGTKCRAVAICGFGLMVCTVAHAEAQVVCGEVIGDCYGEGSETSHVFYEDDEVREEHDGSGFHGDCLRCMVGFETAPWEECHPACISSEEDVDAVTELIIAATRGDVDVIVAVAPRVQPDRVRVNKKRQSLQVSSCDGRIIANLPLNDRYHGIVQALDGDGAAERPMRQNHEPNGGGPTG